MFRFFLATVMLFTVATGYSQSREATYLKKYKRGEFPSIHRAISPEHRKGFPPLLRELKVSEGELPSFEARSKRPIAEARAEALSKSQRDTRVTKILGERFAVIGGGETTPTKDSVRTDMLWIEFYSYSNNRALKVRMIGDEVVDIQQMPENYQPPESREEVKAAAEIVKQDPRYKDIASNLTVRGIQTPSENGNRYLYLLFYREGTKASVFWATVDMTTAQVVNGQSIQR